MLQEQQLPNSGRQERWPGIHDPALRLLKLQSISRLYNCLLGRRQQDSWPFFWRKPAQVPLTLGMALTLSFWR